MYNSLYIGNKDGGIISTITQAPQSEEPVVIIGLGGTGVDAAARLKSKLRKQIIPDNVDAVKERGAEPEYNHIRFLGIDADKKWLTASGLNNAEACNIQNYQYNAIFAPDKLPALKKQRNMQWMSIDYMAKHLPPAADGAGAYRQFGRWLTIESANNIRMKLMQVITQVCAGRNGGALNVHIISGISGGMGAGSFVDVCYIVKDVIKGLGFSAAKTFGYFVLPDAIISKEAIIGAPVKTYNNQKNGIASLLEIEHLMNLKDSNEWFEQDYGAFKIRTQEQLVDMCHFVSATNMNGVPVPNGYEYALNVIGDYILAFASKEQVADGANPITMTGNLTNIVGDLSGMNPDYGYAQNYHIIGSANAEIPTSQMATYLASEIFKKFTIKKEMPNNIQIEQEFADYLKLSDGRFKQLEKQISQKANWIPIEESMVKQYFDQIKAHMNDNILPKALIDPTETSLRQRKGQLLQNRESMEKGIDKYSYQAGASSIPGMALNLLISLVEDPKKGPIYAYGMMNKTGADIFHYLDGRLNYYRKQKEYARDQEAAFESMEGAAKRALGNAGVFNKGQRIKDYTQALNNIYHWQAEGDKFEEMELLMNNLRVAFRNINNTYLKPLYHVSMELIETFAANSTYFGMDKGDNSQDGFTKQLVKFSHIRPELDDAIRMLDPQAETQGIFKLLTQKPAIWMEGEELKLKAEISNYVLDKFHSILSGSLESFLRKDLNMEAAADSVFSDEIARQVIAPFVDAAAPILWTSESVVSNATKTSHRSVLTVPNMANCVCQAADNHKNANQGVEVRKSLINDRIYILRTISGVPMYAYQGLVQYLDAYRNYSEKGLHLYENNVNWRETLTFPYPYSYVPRYTKDADKLILLYNEAVEKGIIYYEKNAAYVKQFADVSAADFDLSDIMENGKYNINVANAKKARLQSVLDNVKGIVSINSKGNRDDNAIVLDNFLRAYGIQNVVKQEVDKYNKIKAALAAIDEMGAGAGVRAANRKVLFDAILVGHFVDDGFNITYNYVEFGMQKQAVLCDNTMPYAGLSKYYQAFEQLMVLEKTVLDKLKVEVNTKFNAMSAADKLAVVDKFMAYYSPDLLAMISNNYIGNPVQEDINNFYKEFNSYLYQLKIVLSMPGM